MPNRNEMIDMDYYRMIEDQRLAAERNQRYFKNTEFILQMHFIYNLNMSRYFCLGSFIEIIKERYSKVTKLIICFDTRKPVEKTKFNQLQQFSYGIVDAEKKRALN
jgi:hypothetical protein